MSGMAAALTLPRGTIVHDHQVAGHIFQDGKSTIGMLKEPRDGSILKAANKPVCGRREIEFYERVSGATTAGRNCSSMEPHIEQLRQLIPEYRGTVQIQMENESVSRMGNTANAMAEPACRWNPA